MRSGKRMARSAEEYILLENAVINSRVEGRFWRGDNEGSGQQSECVQR